MGKPLTKQALTLETRKLLAQAGFNASNYAGHSYRIGAATTAAAAELPSWLIRTLGRWSSDCYDTHTAHLWRWSAPKGYPQPHRLTQTMYYIYLIVINYGDSLPLGC